MVILKDPSGLAEGIAAIGGTLGKTLSDVAAKRAQMSQLQQILNPPQQNISENPQFRQQFVDMINNIESTTGQKLSDQQKDMAWKASINEAQAQIQQPTVQGQVPKRNIGQYAALATINPQLANLMQQQDLAQQRMQQQEKKMEQQEKLAYLKLNEKQKVEASNRLQRLDEQEAEFGRLKELFTTHADKMPSAFKAAFFNYEGESGTSRLGRAFLSPEAQEAIKLITTQIKGLNQTFRGRILETEIRYYMKTLPTLLNTPEGKLKIIRDIELMNKMQQTVENKTLEKLDENPKMTYSDAKRVTLREAKPELEEIKRIFIKPEEQIKAQKIQEGFVWMQAPDGTLRQIPRNKIKQAEAAGGRLVK